jgi:hypothetical protein
MRFSNIVLLLLITLVAFGFLLSHSINLNEQLTQTRDQLAQAEADVQRLEGQYQAIVQEKNQLAGQVSGLNNINEGLQARVETFEAERLALTAQIEELQNKLALMEAAHPILTWLLSSPTGRVIAMVVLPLVPLSLGTVYVIANKKVTNLPTSQRSGSGGSQITFQATLTREEFHLIAMRRRSRSARA